MTDKKLILFALKELQSNIQYAPEEMLKCLAEDYEIEFKSMYQLFDKLSELCLELSIGDENV
jgi:hypothetical protein